MTFYNDGGNDTRRNEVGENCKLYLPGSQSEETAVTNVSFSEEANTSEVQFSDSYAQSIAVTGVTYSGSFEISGRANEERDIGWDTDNSDTTLPNHISTMTIEDGSGRQYTFNNVLLNSHSKDIPSDDRTTQSFDFMAETLTVN